MDPQDYYRPPRADLEAPGAPAAAAAVAGPVYSVRQIAVATFLGSPLAGTIMLGANFRALGKPAARKQTIIWGVVATVAVMVLAFILPDRFPNSVLPIGYTMGMRAAAIQLQGAALTAHAQASGPHQSNWRVLGISIASIVAVLAVMFGVYLGYEIFFTTP
jgi:hypothetical protein